MKKIFILISICALAINSFSQEENKEFEPTHKSAFLEVDKTVHDYGTIAKMAKGDCEFIITNTGSQPLVLNNVQSSCGCTIPDWSKQPIPAGESQSLKVTYDTKRVGTFSKSIKIFSNSPGSPHVVNIKGTVEQ
ncbi:MAG: DUF1573 domain-containing protein [Bacteroidales bacterium]|jgi:hypothetical protein|nr:DUF1573 domain-containing protein [Bacteroidales bacterium]